MDIKTEKVFLGEDWGNASFDKNTYIANDGTEFMYENECLFHEKKIEIKQKIAHIPVKEVKGLGFKKWYYVTSVSDVRALFEYVQVFERRDYSVSIDTSDTRRFVNHWISYIIDEELTYNETGDYFDCEFYSFDQVERNLLNKMEQYHEMKKHFEIQNQV